MPWLRVETNVNLSVAALEEFLNAATSTLATELSKPEAVWAHVQAILIYVYMLIDACVCFISA